MTLTAADYGFRSIDPAAPAAVLEVTRRRRAPLSLAVPTAMAAPPTIAHVKTSTSTITTPKSVSYGANPTLFRFVGNGPGNIGASGYWGNAFGQGTASFFEWSTDAATMDVRLVGLNSKFTLLCDGQRVEDTAQSTDASGGAYMYTVTFPTAVPRTFRVFGTNLAFNGVYVPGTASVWLPTEARRPLAWSLGDSYTFGTGTTQEVRAAIVGMADLLGLDVLPDGIGSTGWNSTGSSVPATRVAAKLGPLTERPAVVFLDLGYNDAGGDMTAAAASFDAAVAAVRAAAPAARVIVFGPATPQGTTANLDLVRTMLQGRAAAHGLPFVDVRDWVNAANKSLYTSGDNVHPTQAGHDFLAARRAQVVSALLAV